ncbi:MAG TPA: hypothetical protein VHH36_00515 [Candidatus Thermoplasmatota archaeon]|nr:hypothetical protein [Candidatus Thermoplasmatota archaeon]
MRALAAALLLSSLAFAPAVDASTVRSEVQRYVNVLPGLSYYDAHLTGGVLACGVHAEVVSHGGACFDVLPGETLLSLDVLDRAGELPSVVWFLDAGGEIVGGTAHVSCAGAVALPIPAGSASVLVHLAPTGECAGDGTPATTGIVVARFV